MRRLLVWLPEGGSGDVGDAVRRSGATQTLTLQARNDEGPVDLLLVHVPNRGVEELVGALSDLPGVHVSMFPQGVLALEPPPEDAPDQVLDVTLRSPLEILLSGLQSIGSWTGYLAYAATGGIVVWVGLFTNTVFLLVAAMLIAPFAGPAMTTALATARGDAHLLRRSLLRYALGLATAGGVAAVLTVLLRQAVTTQQMVDTSTISTAAVILPLAAGAAGALNLSQSERSSLVSGAATGMLVAAALAPPVGVVGMASVLGEWSMVGNGLFLLALQLAGINLSGAVVFRLVGVHPRGARFPRGRRVVTRTTAAATVVLLGALLTWQLGGGPNLQRSTLAQRAAAEVQQLLEAAPEAELIEVDTRFPRADVPGQHTLLVTVYVQPTGGSTDDPTALQRALGRSIEEALRARLPDVTPLVEVTALSPAATP